MTDKSKAKESDLLTSEIAQLAQNLQSTNLTADIQAIFQKIDTILQRNITLSNQEVLTIESKKQNINSIINLLQQAAKTNENVGVASKKEYLNKALDICDKHRQDISLDLVNRLRVQAQVIGLSPEELQRRHQRMIGSLKQQARLNPELHEKLTNLAVISDQLRVIKKEKRSNESLNNSLSRKAAKFLAAKTSEEQLLQLGQQKESDVSRAQNVSSPSDHNTLSTYQKKLGNISEKFTSFTPEKENDDLLSLLDRSTSIIKDPLPKIVTENLPLDQNVAQPKDPRNNANQTIEDGGVRAASQNLYALMQEFSKELEDPTDQNVAQPKDPRNNANQMTEDGGVRAAPQDLDSNMQEFSNKLEDPKLNPENLKENAAQSQSYTEKFFQQIDTALDQPGSEKLKSLVDALLTSSQEQAIKQGGLKKVEMEQVMRNAIQKMTNEDGAPQESTNMQEFSNELEGPKLNPENLKENAAQPQSYTEKFFQQIDNALDQPSSAKLKSLVDAFLTSSEKQAMEQGGLQKVETEQVMRDAIQKMTNEDGAPQQITHIQSTPRKRRER